MDKEIAQAIAASPVGKLDDVLLMQNFSDFVINSVIEGDKSRLVTISLFNENREVNLKRELVSLLSLNSLFMPASRTGLMMLYKEYFANKTDSALNFYVGENGKIQDGTMYDDITRPAYEFIRFLQTYKHDVSSEKYLDELDFFDKNIIEGHISVNNQGRFTYRQSEDDNNIPMYLASSMINEVAPIALALQSGRFDQLIIDEIEASLHPQKQQELARLLTRLSNKNVSLIISTHSDTFVSKINNLFVLAQKEDKIKYLEPLGLDEMDILDTEKLYVYSFEALDNGKCLVKEIKPTKESGYQFDLFMNSNLKIYKEITILDREGN